MAPHPVEQKEQPGSPATSPRPKFAEPSTWQVISVIGGAAWFSYTIWSSASSIWSWVQRKIEEHARKKAEENAPREESEVEAEHSQKKRKLARRSQVHVKSRYRLTIETAEAYWDI